ncbi:Cell division protein FtsW [Moraxella catarrhalis]|nr:Cell division protein FtsW [Moraxella catarrhalis]
MIASASIPFSAARDLASLRFFWYQLAYVVIGTMIAMVVYRIPLRFYYQRTHINVVFLMWATAFGLLILTAAFGDVINGSRRWLDLGIFNLQAGEVAKAVMVFVTADYVVRRSAELRSNVFTGVRLLVWYLPVGGLLLFQPDFGTVLVLFATLIVIIFVSGAPALQYAWILFMAIVLGIIAAWLEPYRRERILSFTDAFDDIQGSDFQLARSLIAYGRGQLSGVGYGDSVQKLSHLPEAHTDFLLAITGEELGFLGVATVLFLEMLIILSIMVISLRALKRRQLRLSYTIFGFAVVIFGQVIINAGMTMGLAPTKGLTMPFFSFGGSSMVVLLIMIGFILRVDKESLEIHAQRLNDKY